MTCIFCSLSDNKIVFSNNSVNIIEDQYPVNPGHMLIILKRHIPDWWGITKQEQVDIIEAINKAKMIIESKHSPAGYNIGINNGVAAGQTIMHLHIHLIPRYIGDMDKPEGGVRHVIPSRGKYSR